MVLVASCQDFSIKVHDSMEKGGYTVNVLSYGYYNLPELTVFDPTGKQISGLDATHGGYMHVGDTVTYPSLSDPKFTIKLVSVEFVLIGFVKVPIFNFTLCTYSDTQTTPPITGDSHLECREGICTRVSGIGPDANCIEGQACSSSNPPSPPDGNLPPPPVLGPEPPLDYSGFMPFIESVYNRIHWLFQFIFDSLAWIISALGGLIPRLIEFILYVLSLQWITDFISQFFARLDIWVSEKFGIDPALPFWEELVKKAIAWLGGGIDEASRKAIQRLK